MNKFIHSWEKLPAWSRWLLLLPAIAFCQFVTMTIIMLPSYFFSFEGIDKIFYKILDGAISCYVLVNVIYELSPKLKLNICYFLFAIIVMTIMVSVVNGVSQIDSFDAAVKNSEAFSGISWIISGFVSLKILRDKEITKGLHN